MTATHLRTGLKMLSDIDSRVVRMAGYDQLYFVGHEGDDEGDPIKIGFSGNAKVRIGGIQNSNWRKVIAYEILHVKSRIDIAAERRFKMALSSSDDDCAAEIISNANQEVSNILRIEQAVHAECKRQGLHHSREWFRGGVDRLTGIAKAVIRDVFDAEYFTNASMLRMAKTWKKEAGLI